MARARARGTLPAMHRPLALSLALSWGVLTLAPPAEATVVRALSLREKVEVAPVVIHGVVERVEVEWEVPGARIQTLVTVKIGEAIKGGFEPGERLILRRGGGQLGDITQTAPGLSSYEPGEEVILFLEPFGPYYVAIGIGIGKYAVGQVGQEKWVSHAPNVAGVTFREGAPKVVEPIQPMTPEPLHQFLKTLRSYARKIPTDPTAMPRKGAVLKPRPSVPATP
jgi:hypothetical protein